MTGMLKPLIGAAMAMGMVLGASPAFAQFGGGPCTREQAQHAVDEYIAAQTEGDQSKIHTGEWVTYFENGEERSFLTGIIGKPLKIDFHRSVIDPQSCSSFTEVVVTDPANPYVLGVTLQGGPGSTRNIDILVTDPKNGWLFNPASTLKYSAAEAWDPIPPGQRMSREDLIKAADAYLNLFNDKTVQVPWGSPCERLEGGMYTGKGGPGKTTPEDSCSVGVPTGVKIVERRYVVDTDLGAVSVRNNFGNNSLPDIHTFRVENGKLRYVHTITVCKTPNCGFKQLPGQQTAQK